MGEMNYSYLDHHFGRFMADRSQLSGELKDRFQELIANLSATLGAGHSCIPVSPEESTLLQKVPFVSDGGQSPLILYNNRLYLHRYFTYEKKLATTLKSVAQLPRMEGESSELLDSLFTPVAGEIDYQRKAAEFALQSRLTIISGGPGTGKTSTVVKILALLVDVAGSPLQIALAAPTGKAAMRLTESIRKSLALIRLPAAVEKAIPTEAQTLHRLLGARGGGTEFQHSSENRMGWDLVVVDEASMVDLALMAKLVDSLKPGSSLILLGDKDQLTSVESGAVFSDLISGLPECSVELQKSYRFDDNIKDLAASINDGDYEQGWRLLENKARDNISLLTDNFLELIAERYKNYMELVHNLSSEARANPQNHADQIRPLFQALNSFKVLCAVHSGKRGATTINQEVERRLVRMGFDCQPSRWYHGRPVLVTRNDYSVQLFNGDVGICLSSESQSGEAEQAGAKVWFEGSGNSIRGYSPFRLPQSETVYAMTIHKSQGSEFDEVVVVLPDQESRVLSRQLIYTAVTRARKSVYLTTNYDVFQFGVATSIKRHSGLAEMLICSEGLLL